MNTVVRYLIPAMWLVWAMYWWAASGDVKATQWRESFASRAAHTVPLIVAFLLLSPQKILDAGFDRRFVPAADWLAWSGAILTAAGLWFAVCARRKLGQNWSGVVTIKVDHALVTSGPYRFVRHPIYSGLLIGFVGTALAIGEWRGVAAVALAALALWRKAALEERKLRRQFGAAYDAYAERVTSPFAIHRPRRAPPRRR